MRGTNLHDDESEILLSGTIFVDSRFGDVHLQPHDGWAARYVVEGKHTGRISQHFDLEITSLT